MRGAWRDVVVVATHEEDLTYRARFRPVTIFPSSFAHPCGRSFIRRSTPPSIFCNFYQARFAPPSRPSTPMYFASDPSRNGSGYFVVGHILDAVVNIWGWASAYSTDERMPIFFGYVYIPKNMERTSRRKIKKNCYREKQASWSREGK